MASEYERMSRKVGHSFREYCSRCGKTTSWTIAHSVLEAGTGLLGHHNHKFYKFCELDKNKKHTIVIYSEKRTHG